MLQCLRTNLDGVTRGVKAGFSGDLVGLKKYKDPVNSIEIETIEDAVYEQLVKLKEFEDAGINLLHYNVFIEQTILGYISCFYDFKNTRFNLVSFALNKEYRKRQYLSDYFTLMREVMTGQFYTVLWQQNSRAIKWMLYNGMKYFGEHEVNGYKQTILIFG